VDPDCDDDGGDYFDDEISDVSYLPDIAHGKEIVF